LFGVQCRCNDVARPCPRRVACMQGQHSSALCTLHSALCMASSQGQLGCCCCCWPGSGRQPRQRAVAVMVSLVQCNPGPVAAYYTTHQPETACQFAVRQPPNPPPGVSLDELPRRHARQRAGAASLIARANDAVPRCPSLSWARRRHQGYPSSDAYSWRQHQGVQRDAGVRAARGARCICLMQVCGCAMRAGWSCNQNTALALHSLWLCCPPLCSPRPRNSQRPPPQTGTSL
jgi:hypothetical protein